MRQALNGPERPLTLTNFLDVKAQGKTEEQITWRAFIERLGTLGRMPKESAPLIKFAGFNGSRTEKGSLRFNAAMTVVSAIEGDYDNEQVPPQVAVAMLNAWGLKAVVATTHSHTPAAPRWRVFCPLSRDYPAAERARFALGLNNALQGILATESATQSQAFYVGGPPGDGEYLILESEGETFIDLWSECPTELHVPTMHERRAPTGDMSEVPKIREALARLDKYEDYREKNWLDVGMALHGWQEVTEGAGDMGWELFVEWCERDPKGSYDEASVLNRWLSFSADKGVTLGTVYHRAEMTRAHKAIDVAAVFAALPPLEQVQRWTTEPVPLWSGPAEAADLLAEVLAKDPGGWEARWSSAATPLPRLLGDLAYASGSNCQMMLEMLAFRPGAPGDTPSLRSMIFAASELQRVHWRVPVPSAEQIEMAGGNIAQVRLPVHAGLLVPAFDRVMAGLPRIHGLFQRDGKLVRVHGSTSFSPIGSATLANTLERYWLFCKGTQTDPKPADCPEQLVKRIVENAYFPGVRALDSISPGPFARADGTAVDTPGFDAETNTFVLEGASRALDPYSPAELQEALAFVMGPLRDFPLCPRTGRAALLSAMLSTVCRPSLPTCPAFLVDAQQKDTGKSKLSYCLALLAGGDESSQKLSKNEEERLKQITTVLRAGEAANTFDNLTSGLPDSAELSMLFTGPIYKSRLLGGNDMLVVAQRTFWVFNGNNVNVIGDMRRRVVKIPLLTPRDVGLRTHSFDPVDDIKAQRNTYREVLLRILATYREAGMPKHGLPPMGSFEVWDKLVRGCVMWLGLGDPLAAIRDETMEDMDEVQLKAVMDHWQRTIGNVGVGASAAYAQLAIYPADMDAMEKDLIGEAFKGQNGNPSTMAFSLWLTEKLGRWQDGRRIVAEQSKALKSKIYTLEIT